MLDYSCVIITFFLSWLKVYARSHARHVVYTCNIYDIYEVQMGGWIPYEKGLCIMYVR